MTPETKRHIKWICDRLADAEIANHQYLAEDAKRALEDCVVGIERLEKWIADLQSGMYVNCIYCGHRYGPGETTPVSMADALKAHAETCAKHPLSAAQAQIESLAEQLGDLEEEAAQDLATIAELRAMGSENAGLEKAAKWVEKRRDDYISEHGSYDYSTGATEFPGNGEEYVYELDEIVEGIRALKQSPLQEDSKA